MKEYVCVDNLGYHFSGAAYLVFEAGFLTRLGFS